MEFLTAGEIRDAARKAAAAADADDGFSVARGRFRGPLRAADHAVASGRLPGPCRSVHLHSVCAGCGAGLPGAMAAKSVPVRADSGHYILFPRAVGRGRAAHPERTSEIEILRSRHGSRNVVRPRGEFPPVPGADSGGVRQDGGHRQFRGAGRHAAREQAAKTDARYRGFKNRTQALRSWRSGTGMIMPDQEKEKTATAITPTETPAAPPPAAPAKPAAVTEEASSPYFFWQPLVGVCPREITGSLIVIEGMDGSGRSTQIALLQEWLESEGFAVQTSGFRPSNLVGRDIDGLLAKNAVTRLTLALMYATDFFDQVEHRILPALRSGTIVLADRFIFTLIARGVVRGINRDYISGLYAMALRPHLTFWLNVRPETAFAREFKKAQAISYWEAGRDMSPSPHLYWAFIRYQTMIKREFEVMAKRHSFLELDGEASVSAVNKQLRQRIAEQLGIRATKYTPSSALAHLWR